MKLCPQCEFIYEDDQNTCDMDGKELVFDPAQSPWTIRFFPVLLKFATPLRCQ